MDILIDTIKAVAEREKRRLQSKERSRKRYSLNKNYYKNYRIVNKGRIGALCLCWKWKIVPTEDLIKTVQVYRKAKEALNEYRSSFAGD